LVVSAVGRRASAKAAATDRAEELGHELGVWRTVDVGVEGALCRICGAPALIVESPEEAAIVLVGEALDEPCPYREEEG
jgi:hypothetical protein